MKRRIWALAWFGLSSGCSSVLGEQIDCPTPQTVVSQTEQGALTCEDLQSVREYVETLSSRPLRRQPLARLYVALRDAHQANAEQVRTQIKASAAWLETARKLRGLEAAEFRSHEVWRLRMNESRVVRKEDGTVRTIAMDAIAIWARSDSEKLALTEMDIEGWIRLGSLCREVQGGSSLKMSIASREQVYRFLRTEFSALPRKEQLGRVAIGPFWPSVEQRWQAASYEQQQAWIRVTPLPPPMTASSLAYMEAVLELSPSDMSAALHKSLGPHPLR